MIRTESSLEDSNVMDKNLHGMDAVKNQVKEIVHMMKYAKLREDRGLGKTDFHNVHLFVGAPGTAKTTMAKLMAKMMQEEGLINGDRFISVTGAQLKGEFVGHTAPKVHALFERYDAIFIDEAYSLTCGSEGRDGIDSFSQEALAQLAIELEEHGRDKLVIFAGYGGKNLSKKDNLMYKFLTSNPGISSRVCSTIYFDSYSPEEMVSIVHHLAKKDNLEMNSDLDGKISEYFAERRGERDFGNGREARAFLESCERCVAHRITPLLKDKVSDGMLNTILPEDIENALKKVRESHSEQMGEYGRKFGIG
jgi:SpoVK/Ycf46/Vps4 family AAA+-type ATPase